MNAIVGLGPVGLMVAALLQRAGQELVFWARPSKRSRKTSSLLDSTGVKIYSELPRCPLDGETIRGRTVEMTGPLSPVENLYLCTPHTEYEAVVENLKGGSFQNVVLLSSGLGSSSRLTLELRETVFRLRAFNNFFGAAKFRGDQLHLKALKRRVFLSEGEELNLAVALRSLGVEVSSVASPLEAELRNITLYAHTAFGLAPHTLEAVFGLVSTPRYLYKLFPEGPVERERTRVYAAFFEEVMEVARHLGAEPFNLLQFLHRDNYPVPGCFLSEDEVLTYPSLPLERKGDLLFARYAGLLVDAGSTPDPNGRFFDFSAVAIGRAIFSEGRLRLPRVQSEELYHLQLLRHLSRRLGLTLKTVERIWSEVLAIRDRLPESWVLGLDALLNEQARRLERVEV